MANYDTSIALGLKPVQIQNPVEAYGNVLSLQGQQQQNQLGMAQAATAERALASENAINGFYQQATSADGKLDRNRLTSLMAGGGQGSRIPGMQKQFNEADKSKADLEKTQLESQLKKFEVAGQIMSGVSDQESWQKAKQQTAQVFGPEAAAQMPDTYDPALVEQKRVQALSVEQQLKQKWEAMKYTTPDANARLSSDTSRANNQASVGASYANAAATRDVAQSNRDAAKTNASYASEQGLRKEFEALPEVKNYKQAMPAYEAVVDAATRNTPQADINLVYGIAKLYDPNSVVREGEYATVANSPNIPEKVKGYAQYLAGGGRLSPETKKQIIDEAKGRMGSFDQQFQAARKDYESISKNSGVDVGRVFPSAPRALSQPAAFDYTKIKSGETYTAPDGTTRRKP
jgi:hypothetical protein